MQCKSIDVLWESAVLTKPLLQSIGIICISNTCVYPWNKMRIWLLLKVTVLIEVLESLPSCCRYTAMCYIYMMQTVRLDTWCFTNGPCHSCVILTVSSKTTQRVLFMIMVSNRNAYHHPLEPHNAVICFRLSSHICTYVQFCTMQSSFSQRNEHENTAKQLCNAVISVGCFVAILAKCSGLN